MHCAALGYRFSVGTTVPGLGEHVAHVLRALTVDEPGGHHYDLVEVPGAERPCRLHVDGAPLAESAGWAGIVEHLLWHVNRGAVAETEGHVLLHAAAAAHGGDAVVLAGASGTGKTTMVAALLDAGLDYVTDEAVAVAVDRGSITPYPRPLSIREGAWPLLSGYEPVAPPARGPYEADRWHVPPPGFVASPSRVRLLLFLERRPGARSCLEPMRRPDALVALAGHAFDLERPGRAGFARLAEVVRDARCARFVVGELAEARDLVVAELAAAS